MPQFFIDTSDGDHFIRDDTGLDLPDVDAARAAAISALPDMAREVLPDGDHRVFLAIVRSEDGQALLQASLALNVASLVPDAAR